MLLFSSLWAAAVAGALIAASGAVLGLSQAALARCVALGFTGTLCVYNIDRLRDLEHDAATAPARTAFVRSHRPALTVLAGVSGIVAAALALTLPVSAIALCALALGLGLLHRRLKGWARPAAKALYVSAAWLAIAVGVPAASLGTGADAAASAPNAILWVLGLMAAPLLANLVATNAQAIAFAAGLRHRSVVLFGTALAGCSAAAAPLAPATAPALGWISLAQTAALAGLAARAERGLGQRYGLLVVDGALIAGALGALAHRGMS